jgi:hypothetical protein
MSEIYDEQTSKIRFSRNCLPDSDIGWGFIVSRFGRTSIWRQAKSDLGGLAGWFSILIGRFMGLASLA